MNNYQHIQITQRRYEYIPREYEQTSGGNKKVNAMLWK